MGPDFRQVDRLGGGLEKDPHRRLQQDPRGPEHEDDDHERGDGVGSLEALGEIRTPAMSVATNP